MTATQTLPPRASRRTAFLYTDDFLSYDLGPAHPLQQRRLQMVYRLLEAYGVFAPQGPIDWLKPTPATEEEILRVHTREYVDAVHRAGAGDKGRYLSKWGLGSGDTPGFEGMYHAAALYAGGTVQAARLVVSGEYQVAFNVAGGLHHAFPDHASGFCTFNDLAMGIHELLAGGCTRVAYIDIDVHHGDGVQACFYDDPRVLTLSIHESGRFLFPRTGFPNEMGVGDGVGTSINVPIAPYTLDDVWHDAFDRVVPEALARFRPEAIVLQLGADAHYADPLAHVLLTSHGWMRAFEKLLDLSDGLPLVLTGGGGYNLKTVTRLWTMVAARAAGLPSLPNDVPETFAAEYGIPHLHDDEIPDTEAEVQGETRAYMEEQVRLLHEEIAGLRIKSL